MATIEINDISLYAYHGCYEEEQSVGQYYTVNISIQANIVGACKNDDLTKTIDYTNVYDIVKAEMAVKSKLIEHVAFRIKQKIQQSFPGIENLQVSIVKINPPIAAGSIQSVK